MDVVAPTLPTGGRLILLRDSGETRAVIVVRVSDGLIWISGADEPGRPGELVQVVYVVPGDAQYQATARIELVPPETLALRRTGEWRRRQRRSQVRLTTYDMTLAIERHSEPSDLEKLRMVDVSAGGAAGQTLSELEPGELVSCSFQLPGEGPFELDARVVRSQPHGGGRIVGFEFVGVSADEQAALRRWIYREEARRHRDAKSRDQEEGETWSR